MAHLKKHQQTLVLLSKSKPYAAKKILQTAPNSLIKAIVEIALNSLNGVIPLTPHKINKLKKYKKKLREVTNAKNYPARRKVLQSGGFISTLLSLAVPLIFKGVQKIVGAIKKRRSKISARKRTAQK